MKKSFLTSIRDSDAVKLARYNAGLRRISFQEAMVGKYEPVEVGLAIGPTWSTHWFRVNITIPNNMTGKKVHLIFDPSCEALVWNDQGEPLMGITGGNGLDRRVDFQVTKAAEPNQKIQLWIEVASNGMFGAGTWTQIGPPDPNRTFTLKTVELVVKNELAYSLYWDLEVMLGLTKELPEQSQLGQDALYCANKIINTIIPNSSASLIEAKQISSQFFEKRKDTGYSGHFMTAIGNCHIDTAWLWPYDESKRKIARSWSAQCNLLDEYPDYLFAASQMQQFEWLEQYYPTLFERIKVAVKEGRFIPIGGTWVEMDCNIPSGEAFCRQFLYGQRYLIEKFGMKSSVFWLPDTFGYSSQLPQIVKSAGLKYFFTQKLSWNNLNKFPHSSFYWKGLDGTSVLTHFSPADTYTAQASVKDIVFSVSNNKDKLYSNQSLLLYGNGDGGGGPLKEMIERIHRFGKLAGFPAEVKHGDPAAFYESLEATSHDLNTWKGELYFELHRGTYTTQAAVKKFNRLCEFLLRKVEMLYAIAVLASITVDYPKAEIDRLWKLVLLNQFHDVLPGSSIGMVYDDALKIYEDVMSSCEKLIQNTTNLLSHNEYSLSSFSFFNSTSWSYRNVTCKVPFNNAIAFQQVSHDKSHGLIHIESIPPFSCVQVAPSTTTNGCTISATHQGRNVVINNGVLQVVLNTSGQIIELIDIEENRNLIGAEPANIFKYYEDVPLFWDAWDVEIYHLEKGWNAGSGEIQVLENGPIRVVVEVVHPLSESSKLRQKIIMSSNSRLIEFENEIQWNENRKILKVEFPLDINCDFATYETQFGILQRPTHSNNSWDWAKFEVCGHKFVDFSEYGYGVALLNDSKYGFAVRDNRMTMSILRAPKSPDDSCDIGSHEFRYALYPHKGTFQESDVVQRGYQFNVPPIRLHSETNSFIKNSVFHVNKENIVIDTIKLPEDKSPSKKVVLRLYEAYGGRGTVEITSSIAMKCVYFVNILEEEISNIPLQNKNLFRIEFTPFQVISLMITVD